MAEKYCSNLFTLKYKNQDAEKEYKYKIDSVFTCCAKRFACMFLLVAVLDFTFEKLNYDNIKAHGVTWIDFTFKLSACILAIISILFILVVFIKNQLFQKIISYTTFILFTIPFLNFIKNVPIVIQSSQNLIIFTRVLEVIIKFFIVLKLLLPYPDAILVQLGQAIIIIIYNLIVGNPDGIKYEIFIVIFQIGICYFATYRYKETFYSKYCLEEKNIRYNNLLEHLNSGFISFKNEKINLLNNCLLESLCKHKGINKFFKEIEENELNTKQTSKNTETNILIINQALKINKSNLNSSIVQKNSEQVLKFLLGNIKEDYNNNDISSPEKLCKDELSLDNMLENLKRLYFKEKKKDKFLLVGFIDFEADSNKLSNKENKKCEVYFRCHEEEFEMIFNDISKVKSLEEKSAELKYKTIFLSKVAHEFKNPLICISEFVNEIRDNYNSNMDNSDSLIQLQSMSEYLLILIKDLDYFSKLQIKMVTPALEKTDTEIKEITSFCKNVAKALIIKSNKTNVNFTIENSISSNFKINTDNIKLKQILINLISNAIKFTNEGFIKLIICLNEYNNIIFDVRDSGIGISEAQKLKINTPFNKGIEEGNTYGAGLGLYIVTQMLSSFESKLQINSQIGHGSSFLFTLNQPVIQYELDKSIDSENILSKNDSLNESNVTVEKNFSHIIQDEDSLIKLHRRRSTLLQPVNNSLFEKTILSINNSLDHSLVSEEKEVDHYLVVDDEIFTRRSTVRILKKTAKKLKKKIKIIEAEDGIDCITLVYNCLKRGVRLKAIISDEMMKHLNGTKTAEILKMNIKNLNCDIIPFYLLTAFVEIKNNFIDCLLCKPFNETAAHMVLNKETI